MNSKQLQSVIMQYWNNCIEFDGETDYKVNKLIVDYALSIGIDQQKLESDVYITVSNMTSSQKRKLFEKLKESNILK